MHLFSTVSMLVANVPKRNRDFAITLLLISNVLVANVPKRNQSRICLIVFLAYDISRIKTEQ